jgi:hypothetical protein
MPLTTWRAEPLIRGIGRDVLAAAPAPLANAFVKPSREQRRRTPAINRWNAWQTFVSALTRSCASLTGVGQKTCGYRALEDRGASPEHGDAEANRTSFEAATAFMVADFLLRNSARCPCLRRVTCDYCRRRPGLSCTETCSPHPSTRRSANSGASRIQPGLPRL